MLLELFLGIICGVGLTSGLTCPPQSDTGTGRHVVSGSHCYMFYKEPLSWAEAEDVCAQTGASLMVMTSDRERQLAADFMNSDGVDVLWLGGQRVAMDWHWLDNTVLGDNFNPWLVDPDADDELDNCAAIIHAALGGPTGWAQKRCATALMYICQVDSENPDCKQAADRKIFVQDPVCYVIFEDKVSWFSARTECERIGGNLASVMNNETQEALLESVEGLRTNGFWFGLRKDKWVWNNGAEVVNSFWDSSNPASEGRCISMRAFTETDFFWETAQCHWEAAYACQMDALDLSTSFPGDTNVSVSTSISESTHIENVSSALTTEDALPDVVSSTDASSKSSSTLPGRVTNPEISVSSAPTTTNGSTVVGAKTTTEQGANDGGSSDSSKAALTGGLAVLAVLLIVILSTVIIFFCCYHRRGKVLRDKARRESVRLEEAAQRRKQQAAAAYYNAAFSEEHEVEPPPPRHNVGVRDQNENHSKSTPRTSVVDLFTASNCRTEAYVSNALRGGQPGTSSGEQSSDRRGRSKEEAVSKDANFGTANSWKFDSEFSVAQSPKKERKQLGNQEDFGGTIPNDLEPRVYEDIEQGDYEVIEPPQQRKPLPALARESPKKKETAQQSQHAVAAAADDVTDPITSNLGDDSLRVLNEYRDDIQQALDTTVEDDNTTLNSEAEENIPEDPKMSSSGNHKPDGNDDDRLHFVLQDLTRQLQMAKEKKKEDSRCNSARDDNPVGSARDSSKGNPTEESNQMDQSSARDKPVSSRLGLLPPIQVASVNQPSGGKKKKAASSNKQKKYSQDNGRQRRGSVGQNSNDSSSAPRESQSRRSSVPSLDGDRQVVAKHRGGNADESESEKDDGESGFTIDDILTGPSFVNQERNGGAQVSGVLKREKLRRDSTSESNEKQQKSRSRPRDSSRDKRRGHSRDSSRDRTRRRDHSKERRQKEAKPRHKHDHKTRRESATALVDSRQSSVESDQDPELVVENTAPPKPRTVNPDSWASPSDGLNGARGVSEKQKMNSSGEGAQFGMGMLLESLDQSAAIEI